MSVEWFTIRKKWCMCSGFVSTMRFWISLLFISERTCLYEFGSACLRLISMSRIFGDFTSCRSFTNPEDENKSLNHQRCINNIRNMYRVNFSKTKSRIVRDYVIARESSTQITYKVGRLMARKPVNRTIRRNQYSLERLSMIKVFDLRVFRRGADTVASYRRELWLSWFQRGDE